jgi:hypothetical protein
MDRVEPNASPVSSNRHLCILRPHRARPAIVRILPDKLARRNLAFFDYTSYQTSQVPTVQPTLRVLFRPQSAAARRFL